MIQKEITNDPYTNHCLVDEDVAIFRGEEADIIIPTALLLLLQVNYTNPSLIDFILGLSSP